MAVDLPKHAEESAGASSPIDASLVIASWNGRSHVLDCLRSILASNSAARIEIIVVDNASSDGSAEAITLEFPAVQLIRNSTNVGFARANNIGIARASGRYVFLVNSDVIVRAGAIDAMIEFMDARPRTGLAGPRVLNVDGSLQPSCRKFPGIFANTCDAFALHRLSHRLSGELMKHWSYDSDRSVDAVSGCFFVVRAAALRQVGGLDETFFMYSEDIDWCIRFHQTGWDVRFCPAAEVVHVGGGSSSADPRRFAGQMLASNAKLYRKHYSRPVAAYLTAIGFVYHVVRLLPRLALYAVRPSGRPLQKSKIERHLGAVSWFLRVDG